jgi:serine/threonine protein kinase
LLRSRLIKFADLEIQDKVGEGAFGVVRRGVLKRGGASVPVAVKQLNMAFVRRRADLSEEQVVEQAARAFYWEALNLALVDHPCVVELLGVCVDEEQSFRAIVLEFCEGGTLGRALNAPSADVWRWAVHLAEALRYLHASGQVHRDIKGENILLSGRVAKFADLGVADADAEFVGEKLGDVRGFGVKDFRWAAPEELAQVARPPRALPSQLTLTRVTHRRRPHCRRQPPTCSAWGWSCCSCATATARDGGRHAWTARSRHSTTARCRARTRSLSGRA